MALELRQQLKLTQQLVMTPQLQQAIKLLQLSRLELVETVQQELMENPFLEEDADDHGHEESQEHAEEFNTGEELSSQQQARATGSEADLLRNAEWEDYLGDFSSTSRQVQPRETEIPESVSFEARLTAKNSLEGHLEWQLRLSNFTPKQLEIGEAVIGNLDSTGYLQTTAEDIARFANATVEEVEATLKRIQQFDPIGVAARSPRECLLVQLEHLGYDVDPICVELVRNHLEDLEKRRYKQLCRKFRITMDELKSYLDILQKLDPMPGASYGSGDPFYISPDVYVYKYGNEFIILLNEEGLPRLKINSFYADNIQGQTEKEKDYMQDKMRSALWLMKSLYQRQRTLYKVSESIAKYQEEFFDYGISRLKPLILKDIAEDIGMHESTVSRITTNKYMATAHGVFELKFFFNSGLAMKDGTQMGSESVKDAIRKLIAEEDPRKPLSDEEIAKLLKKQLQVEIARRTVAKYRIALGIESSSKRKEVF